MCACVSFESVGDGGSLKDGMRLVIQALAQDQLKSLRTFLAAADLPLHLCATFVRLDRRCTERGEAKRNSL